jgi:iron complex transport system permease protein
VTTPSYRRLLAGLLCLTLLAFVASLLIGPAGFNLDGLRAALDDDGSDTLALIFWELRLPRALLGATIGASLALAGACLQGFMRNPLAEPGVIGISSASALGAVIALYSGLALTFPLALPLCAIAGSLTAVLILQPLTAGAGTATLILAGVAVSSLCGALTSLALSVSPNPFASLEIVFWMLGSITDRSMAQFWLIVPFIAAGWVMLAMTARPLDALSLGTETAVSLGVDMRRLRLLITLGAACCVGAATAVSGVIGFVGLVVPHLLRPLVGFHPSRLLPASALGGATLLLSADVLVRLLNTPSELHLGVVTALIGVPFFFYLVLRSRSSNGS